MTTQKCNARRDRFARNLILLLALLVLLATILGYVPKASGQTPNTALVIHNGVWSNTSPGAHDVLTVVDTNQARVKLRIDYRGDIQFRDEATLNFNGVYFPRRPVFAGYIRVKINDVAVYVPGYFDLDDDPSANGPAGAVRP